MHDQRPWFLPEYVSDKLYAWEKWPDQKIDWCPLKGVQTQQKFQLADNR